MNPGITPMVFQMGVTDTRKMRMEGNQIKNDYLWCQLQRYMLNQKLQLDSRHTVVNEADYVSFLFNQLEQLGCIGCRYG